MKFPAPSLVIVLAMAVGYGSCEQPSSIPPPQPDPISVKSDVPLTPPPQPTPAPPTVEPPVEPTTVQVVEPQPFAIEGAIVIEPGRMLTLTISGVTTTATTSGPVPGISWAMYPQSDEARIERNGYAIHYTSPTPCHVWFVASVNNPDPTGKPLTAMKLVTVGQPPVPVTPVVVVPPVVKPDPKPIEPTTPVPNGEITAAVYVYEKDDGEPPSSVRVALDRLNRERKILATTFDDDNVDGDGEVPDQYKAPLAAAKEYQLPVLVLMKRSGPPAVIRAPKTEQEVWEAVK